MSTYCVPTRSLYSIGDLIQITMPVCLSVNESSLQTVYFTYAVITVEAFRRELEGPSNRS